MKLKHYTLAQLLATYAANNRIHVKVDNDGSPEKYAVDFNEETHVQVRDVGNKIAVQIRPPLSETVFKRLYKMRFEESRVPYLDRYEFHASVGGTNVTFIAFKGKSEAAVSPCVSLDLSKKAEAPAVAINVGEPRPAANEEVIPSAEPAWVDVKSGVGQPKEDYKSYSLNHIILPYETMYLQTTFSLKFDFSRVKAHAGVEKCGFICTPNMDRIISDLGYLKTSASPELCQVFDNIKNLKFIRGVAYDDDIAVYLATKDDTTIRVTVIKEAELDEAHAQIPEPVKAVKVEPKTMKEVAISWLRKIFS